MQLDKNVLVLFWIYLESSLSVHEILLKVIELSWDLANKF